MHKTITPAKARKISRSNPMPRSLEKGFIANGWEAHLPDVYARAAELLNENAAAAPSLRIHLNQLLPTIAFYEAARKLTGGVPGALAFMEQWAFREMEKLMPMARALMKTGLYRLMPSLCGLMLDRMFGRSAGFDYRPVPDAPKFAVDMTRCPYVETCARYGVPEMTQFSCRADDVTYGSLHPKLIWARTQTLGTGGACCDFRLHLRGKE